MTTAPTPAPIPAAIPTTSAAADLWTCPSVSLRHADGTTSCTAASPCDLPHEAHAWAWDCDGDGAACSCAREDAHRWPVAA